jgi:hypothetical protein
MSLSTTRALSLTELSSIVPTKEGNPQPFQVDKIIRGWTEGLQLMKEGSKWQLFIPPELG